MTHALYNPSTLARAMHLEGESCLKLFAKVGADADIAQTTARAYAKTLLSGTQWIQ